MSISKQKIKILEKKIGLDETEAKIPIPILDTIMFDINPFDKELADKYWKNHKKIRQRAEEVFDAKGGPGKRLPREEFVKIVDEEYGNDK